MQISFIKGRQTFIKGENIVSSRLSFKKNDVI